MDICNKWLLVPSAAIVFTAHAHATVYLTVEQAQRAIFGNATAHPAFLRISDEQKQEIERRTGVTVRIRDQRIWRVSAGGFFIVDEVVGKHEYITYAVGLNADGSVKQIEIMDYRESYGYQIRNANWREQFVGKRDGDAFKLDADIRNISGATLSCKHVTDGVKRLVALYDVALK
jgi:Na+-translocating ferredoxin:NAD+ oxidoreductase RnfG subunit